MTWTQFKKNAIYEIKSFYYIHKAHKYIKKAHNMLKKDIKISLAYKSLAEAYEIKSKNIF